MDETPTPARTQQSNRGDRRPISAAQTQIILDAFDPEGLLAMGAPADEYASEAESFAEILGRGEVIDRERVSQVWGEWFGEHSQLCADPTRAAALAGDLDAL